MRCDRGAIGDCHPRRVAFTLVEVAVALLIGGVLAASSAVIAVQCVQARQAAARAVEERWSRLRALKQFEQDMQSLLHSEKDGALWITQATDSGVLLDATILEGVSETDLTFVRRLPALVRYRLVPGPATTDGSLVREVRLLTDPLRQPRVSVLADHVAGAAIEYFYANVWHAHPPHGEKQETVNAVRLAITWRSNDAPCLHTAVLNAPDRENQQ